MSEKYPNYQHNSGGEQPQEQPDASPREPKPEPDPTRAGLPEADSDAEFQLRWDISEALLRAVYNIAGRPGGDTRTAAASLALNVVQLTHGFDLASETDRRTLGSLADTVSDRISELAGAYDDLTTSDLQGSVGALAFMLVRRMLPVGQTGRSSDAAKE